MRTPLLLGLFLSVGAGCEGRVYLLLDTTAVPPGSIAMQVVATREDAASKNQPVLALTDLGERKDFSFGLQFPGGTRGRVTVAALTRDSNGCPTGIADAQVDIQEAEARAPLPITAVTSKDCGPPRSLLLLGATPAQVSTGDRVELTGFGFAPRATIAMGGRAVSEPSWLSPARVSLTVPAGLVAGPIDIVVTNPDTTQTRRTDLLTYK